MKLLIVVATAKPYIYIYILLYRDIYIYNDNHDSISCYYEYKIRFGGILNQIIVYNNNNNNNDNNNNNIDLY